MTQITISNMHARGFAFAVTDAGDQVFIPPHTLEGHQLRAGNRVEATLVANPTDRSTHGTPWMCVWIEGGEDAAKPEVEAAPEVEEAQKIDATPEISVRDALILNLIQEAAYSTSAELAEQTGFDTKSIHNSAMRLFNSGKIAKADVYGKCGQARPSFVLFAAEAKSFLEV